MVSRTADGDNWQTRGRQGPLSPAGTALLRWPRAAASEWIDNMNDKTTGLDQADGDILLFDVSDEVLEAAASTASGAAMTFGSPTVSILIACCGDS